MPLNICARFSGLQVAKTLPHATTLLGVLLPKSKRCLCWHLFRFFSPPVPGRSRTHRERLRSIVSAQLWWWFWPRSIWLRGPWPWENATDLRHWIRRRELHQLCWWPQCWCVWFHPGAEFMTPNPLDFPNAPMDPAYHKRVWGMYYILLLCSWNTLDITRLWSKIIYNHKLYLYASTLTANKHQQKCPSCCNCIISIHIVAKFSFLTPSFCKMYNKSFTMPFKCSKVKEWNQKTFNTFGHIIDTSGSSWSLTLCHIYIYHNIL